MWRRFWFKDREQRSKASYAVEVLLAGWIPPLPQLPAITPATPPEKEAAEAGAFLARVYANQEC